jgi:hypothetical protein
MDGVLLEPNGYHMALKETVRLVSQSMGFEDFLLSDEDIAKFEALGISSEWHSSALCAALLVIESSKNGKELSSSISLNTVQPSPQKNSIDMSNLFEVIEGQLADLPAFVRAQRAIEYISNQYNVDSTQSLQIIRDSESIEHSLTFCIFQELVLGSEHFEKTYHRKKQLAVNSYLQKFDKPLLNKSTNDELLSWLEDPEHTAAIMTNRPTASILGQTGTPEAESGVELIGLQSLPIIGNGEIRWLAQKMDMEISELLKPAPVHALAATLAAFGSSLKDSLVHAYDIVNANYSTNLHALKNGTVYVFEDTVAGLISADRMQEILQQNDIPVEIEKLGISADPLKRSHLKDQGAKIYDSINAALSELI